MTPSAARRELVRAAVVAAVVTLLVLGWMASGIGRAARAEASDLSFPRGRVDERVVVVGIDRRVATPEPVGDPVADRAAFDPTAYDDGILWAQVIHAVDAADPRVILLDVYRFAARDRQDDTEVLAGALRSAGTVFISATDERLTDTAPGSTIPRLASAPAMSPLLAAAAEGVRGGHAPFDDPVIPQQLAPLAVQTSDRIASSLALQGAMSLEGLPSTLVERPGGVQVGPRFIPTEGNAQLRVSYARELLPGGVKVISAADVLAGRVPRAALRDKAVVIGIIDPGEAVMVPTTVGADEGLASPLFLAATLNTIVTEDYLTPLPSWVTSSLVAVLAAVVAFVALRVSLWAAPLPALVLAGVVWVAAAGAFREGTVVDVLPLWAACLLTLAAVIVLRGAEELRARVRVSRLFSQYVPETVARQLLVGDRAHEAAAGQRVEITVLFCDLRGFTRLAGRLAPSEVREVLEVYYRHATGVILEHSGTVMQYVGDEVFAVFGAPLADPAHRQRAVACAGDLQAAAADIAAELDGMGVEPLAYGIGLHSGEVVAAHVGTSRRRQYAVVGDPVNVGARLCSMARAGEIVASDDVFGEVVTSATSEPVTPGTLKGVDREMRIYRIRGDSTGEVAAIGGVADPRMDAAD